MSAEASREPRSAADRAWALQALGVAAESSPRQIHAAMLDQLETEAFLPPPPLEQAVLLLADTLPGSLWARDRGTEMLRAREREVSHYVERLAKLFFSLEPAKRRAAWQAAKQRAAFSTALSARLEALEAGLDVTLPASVGDPASLTNGLAKSVCQSFVMVPSARAACHEELLQRALADPRPWQAAARDFQQRYPQLLRLAPQLIASLFQAVALRDAAVKKTRKAEKKVKASRRPAPASSSRPYTWVIVMVVIAALRGLTVVFHASPSQTPTTPPVRPPVSSQETMPRSVRDRLNKARDAVQRGVVPPPSPGNPGRTVPWEDAGGRLRHGRPDGELIPKDGRDALPRGLTPPSPAWPEGVPPSGPPGRRPPR